jgi:hypothetical protein
MKRSRFGEEQIIAILKEAECEPVKTVCARYNISRATSQQWKSKFGGSQRNAALTCARRRVWAPQTDRGGSGDPKSDPQRGTLKKMVSPASPPIFAVRALRVPYIAARPAPGTFQPDQLRETVGLLATGPTPAALHSILHDHRRIVEFDGRIDMKLFANHRSDALVHERAGGTFIVPQIDSASGPAVLRTQELFPD